MASQISFSGSLVSQLETWTPREIYTILKGVVKGSEIYPSNANYVDHVQTVVLSRIGVIKDNLSTVQLMDLIIDSRKFADNIRNRWKKVKGDVQFCLNNKDYLDKPIQFKIRLPKPKKSQKVKKVKVNAVKASQKSKRDLATLSDRTKREESAKIRKNFRKGAIIHCAKRLIAPNGGRKRHCDTLINKLVKDYRYAEKVNREMERPKPTRILAREFLSLMLHRDFAETDNYEIQKLMAKHNANIVPTRYAIRKEKRLILSDIEIEYGNWEVVVKYPSLRRKTLKRFFEIKEIANKFKEIRDNEYDGELELIDIWKWGFDGVGDIPQSDQRTEKKKPETDNDNTTEQTETEQGDHIQNEDEQDWEDVEGNEYEEVVEPEDDDEVLLSDLSDVEEEQDKESREDLKPPHFNPKKILITQCVLIQVNAKAKGDKPERPIWKSSCANCSSGCRPLRICFQSENRQTVCCEYKRVKSQIEEMEVYKPEVEETEGIENEVQNISFEYKGLPTMFDQSAVANIVGVADSSCPICGKTANALCVRNGHFPLLQNHPDNGKHGFQNLHFGPRSMELCLNIAEKNDFKRFFARTQRQKALRKRRHNYIMRRIHTKLGFWVNKPLPGSHGGSSNTGNAARRTYKNARSIAEILKIPYDFIKALGVIWEIIRCPFAVDSTKAQAKADEVLDMYFRYFKTTEAEKRERRSKKLSKPLEIWYKISSSVHKILEHMKLLLDNCPVPPGMVSEEGPECNNGRLRSILDKLTRKMTRLKMLTDLVNRLLLISDPLMLEFVKEKALEKRKKRTVSPEVRELLLNPNEEDLDQQFLDEGEFEEAATTSDLFDGEVLENADANDDNDEDYVDVSDEEEEVIIIPPTATPASTQGSNPEDIAQPSTSNYKDTNNSQQKESGLKKKRKKPKKQYIAIAESSDTEFYDTDEESNVQKGTSKEDGIGQDTINSQHKSQQNPWGCDVDCFNDEVINQRSKRQNIKKPVRFRESSDEEEKVFEDSD